MDAYSQYAIRVASGDYMALIDSPIMSTVVESMLYCLPSDTSPESSFKQIGRFFASEHFAAVPEQLLSARIFAVLKDMVKRGAYTNRENALNTLSGFFQDVRHISTYAPYCNGFVMDKAMASIVADPRVRLESTFGVKVFSVSNWDELLAWLDHLKAGMTDEHKAGLRAAYG